MTQQSEHATNPKPTVESDAPESPVAESPAASSAGGSAGGSLAAQASAIDLAFDQETDGRPQASQEETRIGRVVSVSGSQVIVMLEHQNPEGAPGPGSVIVFCGTSGLGRMAVVPRPWASICALPTRSPAETLRRRGKT